MGRISFGFKTLGCKVNQADTEQIINQVIEMGGVVPEDGTTPEIMVINGCTVTSSADRDGRAEVYRALRMGVKSVILTGCLAMRLVRDGEIRELTNRGRVRVVPATSDRTSLIKVIKAEMERLGDIGKGTGFRGGKGKARRLIKVQDGCDCKCAYCIVPYMRGHSRSVPLEDVIRKVEEAKKCGTAEVVLTGVDLGSWGKDFHNESGLAKLLEHLIALKTDIRFRLSSLEPHSLDKRIIDMIAENADLCPHIHIPIQSGSDRILKAMGRPYSVKSVSDLIMYATKRIRGISIGLDIICGFPSEGEDDHLQTVRFIQEHPITYLHVFPFSSRPKTAAEAMEGQIDLNTKKERAEDLRRLSFELRREHMRRLIGSCVEVVSIKERDGGLEALANDYTRVFVIGGKFRNGRYFVRIEEVLGQVCIGRYV